MIFVYQVDVRTPSTRLIGFLMMLSERQSNRVVSEVVEASGDQIQWTKH